MIYRQLRVIKLYTKAREIRKKGFNHGGNQSITRLNINFSQALFDRKKAVAVGGSGLMVVPIEEGFIPKRRQRLSLPVGEQNFSNPCRASYFVPG